jgi:hypothetical protein
MTWVLVLLWGLAPATLVGVQGFGASTAVGFGSKDLCEAALASTSADIRGAGLTVFSATCQIQSTAGGAK